MEFLKLAVEYAQSRGDYNHFTEYYTKYRESHGVVVSAEYALLRLYGWQCHLFDKIPDED